MIRTLNVQFPLRRMPFRFYSGQRNAMCTLISRRQLATHANDPASTMPPNHIARVGSLQTFSLPQTVSGGAEDVQLANDMIMAWRRDGILQVQMDSAQRRIANAAYSVSKKFFARPLAEKASLVDPHSYAGYIALGEEITDNVPDVSEVFTVTKDLPSSDWRVRAGWPCHGRVPWADAEMETTIQRYMSCLGNLGERLLQLVAHGLGLESQDAITQYTRDGWHHLRILKFPPLSDTNSTGPHAHALLPHRDYGNLVIASQDDVGGLFVKPPNENEKDVNLESSSAGVGAADDDWVYVPPVPGVFTVFPGDMMQYMTNAYLQSTPHKVGLNTRERFAFAYFHEPNFSAVVKPLKGYDAGQKPVEGIHYGTHFTNKFLNNYPKRITTERLVADDRLKMLQTEALRTMPLVQKGEMAAAAAA